MYLRIMSSAEMVFTQKAKKSNESYKSLKCIFIPHGANFGFLNYINKVSKNLGSQDSQPHGKCLNRNQNQEMCSKISIEKYDCVGSGRKAKAKLELNLARDAKNYRRASTGTLIGKVRSKKMFPLC